MPEMNRKAKTKGHVEEYWKSVNKFSSEPQSEILRIQY
jgi:hypothetical protein